MRLQFADGFLIVRHAAHSETRYRLPRRQTIVGLLVVVLAGMLLANRQSVTQFRSALAQRDAAGIGRAATMWLDNWTTGVEIITATTPPPQQSELETIRLEIPNNTFLQMQKMLIRGDAALGHDPGGKKPYFGATLIGPSGHPQRCKICLRGAMSWHHQPAKPSLRIKIDKDDLLGGDRYIELSRPEDLLAIKNWLPLQFAKRLGLMTSCRDHVRLVVNNRHFGVYERSMRQGEPLALANLRMPGTFFKGDFAPELWASSASWKISGEMAPADVEAFDRLLQLLRQASSATNISQLNCVLDSEKYARWSALMAIVGSVHTDSKHNHAYFLCSNQGLIEPIPWDCNGLGIHTEPGVPVDLILHPLASRLHCDPRWVHRRNQLIHESIHGALNLQAVVRMIDEKVAQLAPDLRADRNLADLRFTFEGFQMVRRSPLDLDDARREAIDWLSARFQFLHDYLQQAAVLVSEDPDDSSWSLVQVQGSAAVRVHRRDNQVPLTNSQRDDPTLLFPALSESLSVHRGRPYGQGVFEVAFAKPAAMVYRVQGKPDELLFSNAITGEPVQPVAAVIPPTGGVRTIHPGEFPAAPTGTVELGPGIIELTGDLLIGCRQQLVIHPGTTIRLAAGAGVYSRGKVTAIGTAEQPIRLLPLDPQPWCSFAIWGLATAGSEFRHMHVRGGSVGQFHALRFKGMFNVYNCPQVRMHDCHFGDNQVGDDAVNIAESDLVIDGCHWRDARADALDLDMCRGVVRHSSWEHSGNDAIDLMGCRVVIEGARILGSGDKGISIGENTRAAIFATTAEQCAVAAEVKDQSRALLVGCHFTRNGTGVHAYQKKWFYDSGGHAALVNCSITDSQLLDVDAKKRSQLLLLDTGQPAALPGEGPVRQVHSLDTQWDEILNLKSELGDVN